MKRRNLFKAAAGTIASLPILKALDPAPVEAEEAVDYDACEGLDGDFIIDVGQSYDYDLPGTEAQRNFARWVEEKEPAFYPFTEAMPSQLYWMTSNHVEYKG